MKVHFSIEKLSIEKPKILCDQQIVRPQITLILVHGVFDARDMQSFNTCFGEGDKHFIHLWSSKTRRAMECYWVITVIHIILSCMVMIVHRKRHVNYFLVNYNNQHNYNYYWNLMLIILLISINIGVATAWMDVNCFHSYVLVI